MRDLKLPFSLFLALRYLKPKRTFVSIITLISIAGVMLGVTVLILVISVMTGFDRELRQKVIDFDAHILVSSQEVLRNWRDLTVQIRNTPGVVATAPYVQGPVIAQFRDQRLAPFIRGIDPEEEENVIPIRKFVVRGEYNLEGDSAIIGVDLARELQINVGDRLTIYSPGNLNEIFDKLKKLDSDDQKERAETIDELREVVLPKDLTITGIFQTGHYLHDSQYVLVPVHIGQELYALGDTLHGITIRTVDPYGAEEVRNEIEKFLTPPEYAKTWIDMNSQYFEAVRLERTVMYFICFFIVIVAAFGITSTLITVTVQKTREIGIIKAIGANTAQIVLIFLAQGMIVGLFGTLSGLGLGMTLIRYRNEFSHWLSSAFGIEVFPRQIYQFSQIPAEVIPSDVAKICVIAFIICSLAALVPAYNAARKDPVEALRFE